MAVDLPWRGLGVVPVFDEEVGSNVSAVDDVKREEVVDDSSLGRDGAVQVLDNVVSLMGCRDDVERPGR